MTLNEWENTYGIFATHKTDKGYRSVALTTDCEAHKALHGLEDYKHHVTVSTNETSIVWLQERVQNGPFRVQRIETFFDVSLTKVIQSKTETCFYRTWKEVADLIGRVVERVKTRSYGSNEITGDFGQGFPTSPPRPGATKFCYYNDPNGSRILYVVVGLDPFEWFQE